MPAQYEAIRDRLAARGTSYDEAQRIAAATYNRDHPKTPVTGHAEPKTVARVRRDALVAAMRGRR